MGIYSPSSTLEFQRCPRRYQLSHTNLRARQVGNGSLAAAVGVGFSVAMENYFSVPREGVDVDLAIRLGQTVALGQLEPRLANGATLGTREEKTFELIPKRIEKMVRGFHKQQPFPSDWHDFMPELAFPQHGNCRVDLMFNSDFGPTILDFKTKVTASDWTVDNFMFDAETSWQLNHYVWAAREMGIDVTSTAICLVVCEPFDIRVDQWVVDEDRLVTWLEAAQHWWAQMDRAIETDFFPMVGDHRDPWGLCDYYRICMDNPTESQIAQWYQTVERTA